MNMARKIRLGSVLVIANGLGALATLPAGSAVASSCGPVNVCFVGGAGVCASQTYTYCESITPPGCSYVSTTCTSTFCGFNGGLPQYVATCNYQ